MKAFQLIPAIAEYADFGALASELKLGPADLILTNEYIYNPTIASLNLGCQHLLPGEVRRRRADRRDGGRDSGRPAGQGL